MSTRPILWSFRRCPYAIRARMGLVCAGITVELREILLRDKPAAFLETSPSATVPALQIGETVLDESYDIMVWALQQHDPLGLLEMPRDGHDLITHNDGPFKKALDRTKYATRYPDVDAGAERAKAVAVVTDLDRRLRSGQGLVADRVTLADYAIFPFVRQFAHIDRAWFDAQPWPALILWLNRFTESAAFNHVMTKHAPWQPGDAPVLFP